MKKVGIIGGSGFIGSYITKQFLQEGYYVKVSTTDVTRREKYEHLLSMKNAKHLEIVQLDVENKIELTEFLQGCEIIIHGGTPAKLEVNDVQKEIFDPTIKGTENLLKTIQQIPGVNKVVFIASVAVYNTNFPLPPEHKTEDDQIDEEMVPFMSEDSIPYAKAKFIANKVVKQFIEENENISFEIVSVSPVGVMGKSLSQRQDSGSTGLQFLLKNKIAPNPFVQMFFDNDIYFAIVDVEMSAEAIYRAATIKGIHGKNYLLSSESYRVSDITLLLNNQSPVGKPIIVYNSNLAQKDLDLVFKPASVPLNNYSS